MYKSLLVLFSQYLQLEERIDSLSKEARAHKAAAEAGQMTVHELREELKQVCLIVYGVYNGCLWLLRYPVRVAEWSKAPDSSVKAYPFNGYGGFWSTYVGVGSNPTSDKYIFFPSPRNTRCLSELLLLWFSIICLFVVFFCARRCAIIIMNNVVIIF